LDGKKKIGNVSLQMDTLLSGEQLLSQLNSKFHQEGKILKGKQ
jgi:hypothetical protein